MERFCSLPSANWLSCWSCHAEFLECAEIPGGLLAAQESPWGGSQKLFITPQRHVCFANRCAGWGELLVTIPPWLLSPQWEGQLGSPDTDSGRGNQVNAMHRQITPCKVCLTKSLHGAIKLCLCTYCSTYGHWNWSWKLWKESWTSWKILIRLSLKTFHLPGLSGVHFKDGQGFIKGLSTSIKAET